MAKRKSIFDDIVGGFVGAAKGVGDWSQSQARTFTNPYVNAAGRAIGKNPNLPVSGAKEAITNTAFGVVDVASGPIGRVAVKGARAAAGAVAKTGVPARVVNKVTKQQILVHGSPTQGLTVINPTRGINRNKGYGGEDKGLRGFFQVPSKNPQFGPSIAINYALGDQERNIQQNVIGQGSIYIARAKKPNLIFQQARQIASTPVPSPVVSEIRLNSVSRDKAQSFLDRYVAELKAAGGATVPRKIRKQSKKFR